jgi:hypothetical protein
MNNRYNLIILVTLASSVQATDDSLTKRIAAEVKADLKKDFDAQMDKAHQRVIAAEKHIETIRINLVKQVVGTVLIFLKEQLPRLVINIVKEAFSLTVKTPWNKVKGWFGYGQKDQSTGNQDFEIDIPSEAEVNRLLKEHDLDNTNPGPERFTIEVPALQRFADEDDDFAMD